MRSSPLAPKTFSTLARRFSEVNRVSAVYCHETVFAARDIAATGFQRKAGNVRLVADAGRDLFDTLGRCLRRRSPYPPRYRRTDGHEFRRGHDGAQAQTLATRGGRSRRAFRAGVPAGARDHAAAELAAATGRGDAGRRAGRDRGVRRRDAARARATRRSTFAWSTAATIEPWVEGVNFFPRIFADVEAARSSVHILMFGWREGEMGMRMAALLERKLAEGVEVRVIVDGLGSRPYAQARAMFTRPGRGGRADRRQRRASRPTATASSPTASGSTGARTRSAAPTTASSTSSTARSPGRAARASRTTSRTAASTT